MLLVLFLGHAFLYFKLYMQDHYDFGMRALKSVLVMAGALRREHPSVPESHILIRAMRDANLPKFLSEVGGTSSYAVK